MAHRVLGHRARLDELEQVVGAAGLRPGARQAVAAERLAADHRAGDPAVDVQVADRGALADVADGRRIAREQPAGERERKAVDDLAGRARRRGPARSPAAARRSPRSSTGEPGGRSAATVGGQNQPRSGTGSARGDDPCPRAAASVGVARDPLLRRALDHRRHLGAELARPGRRRARGPRRRPARSAGRRSPRGRARAPRPSTSGRRRRTPRRRSPGTASSRSASASTITQFLPPSSATTRLMCCWPGTVSAAARTISSPTGSEPVNAIVWTAGWRTSAAPTSPSPGSSEIAAGGTPPARSACDEPQRAAGRLLGGLEHDRVAGGERGRGHPAGDREREVPGRDHRRDAARARSAARCARRAPAAAAGPRSSSIAAAGVVLEEVDRLAHVGVGLGPRLRALADLERGELEPPLAQPGGGARRARRRARRRASRATSGTRHGGRDAAAATSASVARRARRHDPLGVPGIGRRERRAGAGARVGRRSSPAPRAAAPVEPRERVAELRAHRRRGAARAPARWRTGTGRASPVNLDTGPAALSSRPRRPATCANVRTTILMSLHSDQLAAYR